MDNFAVFAVFALMAQSTAPQSIVKTVRNSNVPVSIAAHLTTAQSDLTGCCWEQV